MIKKILIFSLQTEDLGEDVSDFVECCLSGNAACIIDILYNLKSVSSHQEPAARIAILLCELKPPTQFYVWRNYIILFCVKDIFAFHVDL